MVKSKGALYKLVDKLFFGPIEPGHLADWIEARMTAAGIDAAGIGHFIVQQAGPRTRDIVQVARRCYDQTRSKGQASRGNVENAFEDIVAEEQDLLYESWLSYTAHQQNVLRAVAAGFKGLTTAEMLSGFSLGSSGTTANTASSLVKTGCLIRKDPYTRKKVPTPTGYDFDSPFFKHWVIHHTLSDIGLSSANLPRVEDL
jgi:hypothetical protein